MNTSITRDELRDLKTGLFFGNAFHFSFAQLAELTRLIAEHPSEKTGAACAIDAIDAELVRRYQERTEK